jgi:hypothetical protein
MLITETSRIPEFIPLFKDLSFRGTSKVKEMNFHSLCWDCEFPFQCHNVCRTLVGWLTRVEAGSAFGSEFALNGKKKVRYRIHLAGHDTMQEIPKSFPSHTLLLNETELQSDPLCQTKGLIDGGSSLFSFQTEK